MLEHRFPLLWVNGEISSLTRAKSGHLYFVLKDAEAQIRCVMFRQRNQYLDWAPREGLQVDVRAVVTLYEARGEFQLTVDTMRRAGTGALFEAFLRLRDRLALEGLFDTSAKREAPQLPRAIGIVTSLQAAALQDILITLKRRNPSIPIVIYPCAVQGVGAAEQIARAIECAGVRNEVDVLIVARGGGSIEDLWSFNEEIVARAIRACAVPVISGVGHETDFTIADFAADIRAPTPTAAAELVSPSRQALLEIVGRLSEALTRRVNAELEARMQKLDYLSRRLIHPGQRIARQTQILDQLVRRLRHALRTSVETRQWRLARLQQRQRARAPAIALLQERIEVLSMRLTERCVNRISRYAASTVALERALGHLDPRQVLERGYSLVRNQEGMLVVDAATVAAKDVLAVTLARGELKVHVESAR